MINVLLWALSFIILMACTAIAVGTLIVAHAVVAFGCCFAPVFYCLWHMEADVRAIQCLDALLDRWRLHQGLCHDHGNDCLLGDRKPLADLKGKLSGWRSCQHGDLCGNFADRYFQHTLRRRHLNIAGDMIGATTLGGDATGWRRQMGAARITEGPRPTRERREGCGEGAKNAAVSFNQGAVGLHQRRR